MRKNAASFMVSKAQPATDPLAAARAKAVAWVRRGMPDDEIVYDEQAPKLTEEQLEEFEPASFRFDRLTKS
ncbi:MAG: hypothetical protein HQL38_20180 [Alphaproteobacteria bacterium]|nr:hypothetical protein [Alphaproteobacteria bacterium]MBF0395000.1 hypothetical protein [Alphaproteobacteria bacterium]